MDFENHPTFCAYPWVHRLIDTNGNVKLCCRDQGAYVGHVKTMDRDWNGPVMRDVRKRLSSGEKIAACKDCWTQEAHGKTSHRQQFTKNWINRTGIRNMVERSLDADMWVDTPPAYIEVRFGNLCNLTCKMCIGHSSTQVLKDAGKLKKADPKGYAAFLTHEEDFIDQDYEWYEDAENWEQIDQIIPHLRNITITGGEPTLIKKNMNFLKRIIKLGYASNISVDITTNLTNINERFLDLMSQFKVFHVAFSLDGFGDHYEYIRYPANWDTIETNMKKVLAKTHECDTIRVGVHMVAQTFNILYLADILDKLVELLREGCARFPQNVSSISITPIFIPAMFSISGAPTIVKAATLHRIEEWLATSGNVDDAMILLPHGTLDMIINQLKEPEQTGRAKKLLDYCRFIDQNKRVSLQQKIPELARLLEVSIQ